MGAEASSLEGAEAVLVDGDHNRGRGKVAQRREHSVEFIAAVAAFNAKHCAPPGGGALAAGDGRAGPRIRVAVRKRPLFEHERARRDFDVVSCAADGVWLHRCMMRADLKHMACESFDFAFPDGTFAETEDTDAVFRAAVAPLVASAAQDGGVSTVMCFGQTGSGKTYTMGGLADRVAAALFAALDVASRSANRSTAAFYGGMTVGAVCVEVAGSKIRDLLGDDDGDGDGSSNNAVVKLLEDEAGIVHLRGATEAPTADGAQLAQALRAAQARRASAATGVHDASSRSHSVCRVTLRDGATGAQFARVDLVDLAGSEWAADREKHDKRRQREGIEINASLMALKACMRSAIAPGTTDEKRLPYRQSALTKLLKTAFVGEGARTLLLATVSPASADTEHTLSTLQHVAAIAASGEGGATGATGAAAVAGGRGGAEAEAGAALQTEATKVARRVLTTNVKQARALLREMEGGGGGGAAAEGEAGGPETGWEVTNPIDWTPTDVCVWWTEAATRGVTLINDAVAAAPPAGGAPPSPTAEESLSLVLEAGGADGPLGLSFVKEAAAAAEGASCAALPVVGSVKAGSAVAIAHAARGGSGGGGGAGAGGLKGWRLLGVAGTAAPRCRAEVLGELKACAKERPLALLFWPPLPPVEPTGPITRSPAVPRIFTGKSRLGEADGDYLCATFNQKRFVDDATDPRLGRLMYAELHQIIKDSGGPFTPGVDGGCAEGGDGGERARRKAEEHAAAEAAKWGR